VSDGRLTVGTIDVLDGVYIAVAADGKIIGRFETLQAAMHGRWLDLIIQIPRQWMSTPPVPARGEAARCAPNSTRESDAR
jgi:hypothetical protein